MADETDSLLAKLDKVAPASLNQFDAFPKLPSTYKARSGERGFLTVLVALVSFLLIANDIGEFIWGWPTYDFGVDHDDKSFMNVNVDVVVNMPCGYLSVDLRDAVGDRLFLSNGFRRDGTLFDVGQAQTLAAHSQALSAREAVTKSRKSRGLLDVVLRRSGNDFHPTYNYQADGRACRVYGSMEVKKVTANLHITTLGHGYASRQHVPHEQMNLSHVITDFSFGPYFPQMTQPLKNTLEIAHDPFVAYQYFLSVVPTTYKAPRLKPVQTNQYSVTHYTRVLTHDNGTPGIFFKFDLEPLRMTVHQKTTTLVQFLIRVVGVVGGVWCCAGWAFRISAKAIDVVSGADRAPGIVAAESTGTSVRRKWTGGELRSRVTRQGNGWTTESPYASYVGTPVTGSIGAGGAGAGGFPPPYSPYVHTPAPAPYTPHTPASPYVHPGPGAANGGGGGGAYAGLGLPPSSPSMFAAQQARSPPAGGGGGVLGGGPGGVLPPTMPSFGPHPPSAPTGTLPLSQRTPSRDKETKKD